MKVFVECYHDKALVRTLGISVRDLYHEGCKGNVMKRLRKTFSEAVGLVDEDPGSGGSPSEMNNYSVKSEAHGVRLYEHKKDSNRQVIEICPRLEDWRVNRAERTKLSLTEYGLPATARVLHKNPRCDRNPGFRQFLADLLEVDEGMQILKEWLGMQA